MTNDQNETRQDGNHGATSTADGYQSRRHSLATLVAKGVLPIAEPRSDTDELNYVVRGCFACGGPEDARHSFTTLYQADDGNLDDCWLCQPCVRLIFDTDPTIIRDLRGDDILSRNPELRKAYVDGRIERTGDLPAGFVLSR